MNLFKSIFISHYMMLAMATAAYAGWMLYQGADPVAWTGTLLTVCPITMVIGWLMMFKNIARTSAHFPLINLLGASGVGLSGYAFFSNSAYPLPLVLAGIGWSGFLLYAYWFSSYGGRQPSKQIALGAKLPEFSVRNADGTDVSSAQLTDKPAILIFYRGNWCPLCMAQVKELVGRYREISSLGVRVALISPQPHRNTESLAKKFGVAFDFLTDEGNAAARALGIAQPHGLPMGMQMMGYDGETVLPTVIITDATGKVIWRHETDNYRIRPEPDLYLDVLQRHGITAAA